MDRGEPPLLDVKIVEALRDDTVRDIAHSRVRLPDRERRLLLGIAQQFASQGSLPGD